MTFTLNSLPDGYRAIVIGSTGAIGAAITDQLRGDSRCSRVVELARSTEPSLDYLDESSIAAAANSLQHLRPFHLIVVATGTLHGPGRQPEKRLGDINYDHLMTDFTVNAFGPAVVIAHFSALMPKHERSLFAVLSAKVGSIGDNRLGGWYSYRASKAALNMLMKTSAIELARTHPHAVVAALHPGTVESPLSAPFRGASLRRSAQQAAADLLSVLDRIPASQSGSFVAYTGQPLPW